MSDGISLKAARAPSGLRLYAIGDIHGCSDLLRAMHAAIDAELDRDRPADWRVIHIGDYIDNGPDSRGVLDQLVERSSDSRMLFLRGNHEQGFVDFLHDPSGGEFFADHGGEWMAQSYGVSVDFSTSEGRHAAHTDLVNAMRSSHLDFLQQTALSASFGDYFFCHAGIRPGIPLDRQEACDLLNIRKEFSGADTLHPKIIVHGHTPIERAQLHRNRINIDTGVVKSGLLSAIALDADEKRVLEVRSTGR
ncbi:metallophosphoesterase family protein [Tianweitania sediminis]|uniref:Serine/threonine protein phosphatase n=1 Tax=Tianweitania sediminis TaxID=1502156 RepID=A0A8J7RHL9_9HYPH|nr:serine/threonine protein phosphatase [Tianweitania sediminis]